MSTENEKNKRIKATLDAAESIKKVEVSPFFKEKVMHQIRNATPKVKETSWVSWFTPRYQLATLVGIVALNIMAFQSLKENNYEVTIENFAESFGISTSLESTLIY